MERCTQISRLRDNKVLLYCIVLFNVEMCRDIDKVAGHDGGRSRQVLL